MPTYEYECEKCGLAVDITRKLSEKAEPVPCPNCGKPMAQVITGGNGFVLKGGGWYKGGGFK